MIDAEAPSESHSTSRSTETLRSPLSCVASEPSSSTKLTDPVPVPAGKLDSSKLNTGVVKSSPLIAFSIFSKFSGAVRRSTAITPSVSVVVNVLETLASLMGS